MAERKDDAQRLAPAGAVRLQGLLGEALDAIEDFLSYYRQ